MKEIEKKELPEIGGGAWNEDGCIPGPVDPTKEPIDLLIQMPPETTVVLP